MLLNDSDIKYLAHTQNLITPFVDTSIKEVGGTKVISYGLAPHGYDLRLYSSFKVAIPRPYADVLDPKQGSETFFNEISSNDYFLLAPKATALGRSVETINIPSNLIALITSKSTYARCGLLINNTTSPAGFKGHLVFEFYNSSDNPIKLYPNEGIAHLVFLLGKEATIQYNGVYQNQVDIVTAKV